MGMDLLLGALEGSGRMSWTRMGVEDWRVAGLGRQGDPAPALQSAWQVSLLGHQGRLLSL
jgi:hypothetical protein